MAMVVRMVEVVSVVVGLIQVTGWLRVVLKGSSTKKISIA